MKKLILIFVVFVSCTILTQGISIASDYASDSRGYQETTIPGVTSNSTNIEGHASEFSGYRDTTTSNVKGNGDNAEDYTPKPQNFPTFMDTDYSKTCRGFHVGLSYWGPCDSLPKGAICLIYSDKYKWVVSDIRIDPVPLLVGVSNYKLIELIRCNGGDYYHVLGTSLVMSTPCLKTLSFGQLHSPTQF